MDGLHRKQPLENQRIFRMRVQFQLIVQISLIGSEPHLSTVILATGSTIARESSRERFRSFTTTRFTSGQSWSENKLNALEEKGRVLEVRGQSEWMNSHATAPTAYHLRDDLFRVYFSTRDKLRQPSRLCRRSICRKGGGLEDFEEPVLRLGSLGHFDCDGVYGTSLVQTGDELRLYYAGWNAGLRGLFYSSIGVAVSRDGGDSFQRLGSSPILGRDEIDPWAVMAPFVLKVSDHHWVMWYASGIELSYDESNTLRSSYDVKTALSSDGLNWKRPARPPSVSVPRIRTPLGLASCLPEMDSKLGIPTFPDRSINIG